MGCALEGQVRNGLFAAIGPRHEGAGFCFGRRIAGPNGGSQKGLFLMRYRWFESISLQRRVHKPSVPPEISPRGTDGSNPCALQSGYWLVGIVDWPNRAGLPGVARE